ncbi:MAG TPA: hypothetical protein DCW68_04850, partial [Rhodospirillaceae bacterium]|nr:hypothetical protein [Rhodospirillaceae bacterium]
MTQNNNQNSIYTYSGIAIMRPSMTKNAAKTILFSTAMFFSTTTYTHAYNNNHSFRIRKQICDYTSDSSCVGWQTGQSSSEEEGFSLSFPSVMSLDPMEIVSSGNRALTGLPEPAMAWIEAPESADAAFVLDGTWHMVGDDPVPVDSTTILMLSATTPATRGTGFDITLHVGSYSAIWHIRTMSEDGIIFTSIPTAFAYQGQPYTYPIATYSANMEAIPVISLLETADWLTLAWEADSFTATLSGITPGSMAVFEPGDTPAFATTGGTSSTYGSHYSY